MRQGEVLMMVVVLSSMVMLMLLFIESSVVDVGLSNERQEAVVAALQTRLADMGISTRLSWLLVINLCFSESSLCIDSILISSFSFLIPAFFSIR